MGNTSATPQEGVLSPKKVGLPRKKRIRITTRITTITRTYYPVLKNQSVLIPTCQTLETPRAKLDIETERNTVGKKIVEDIDQQKTFTNSDSAEDLSIDCIPFDLKWFLVKMEPEKSPGTPKSQDLNESRECQPYIDLPTNSEVAVTWEIEHPEASWLQQAVPSLCFGQFGELVSQKTACNLVGHFDNAGQVEMKLMDWERGMWTLNGTLQRSAVEVMIIGKYKQGEHSGNFKLSIASKQFESEEFTFCFMSEDVGIARSPHGWATMELKFMPDQIKFYHASGQKATLQIKTFLENESIEGRLKFCNNKVESISLKALLQNLIH